MRGRERVRNSQRETEGEGKEREGGEAGGGDRSERGQDVKRDLRRAKYMGKRPAAVE